MDNDTVKNLDKTLPAFLVYPFKEIPESGNCQLKNMNIFITSLCTLSNCYLESLKQFLGLPPLQNDSLQIITRIYFNLLKIFANVQMNMLYFNMHSFVTVNIICMFISDLYFPLLMYQ